MLIDHTTGETPPELFEKSFGLFYILFELTNEKMKEIRPTPNITAWWNGYLSKGEKWELHDLSSFKTLVGGQDLSPLPPTQQTHLVLFQLS